MQEGYDRRMEENASPTTDSIAVILVAFQCSLLILSSALDVLITRFSSP